MSDANLLQTLQTKTAYTPPLEADISHAVTLLTETATELDFDTSSLTLSGGETQALQSLKALYQEQALPREERTVALCMAIEYALAQADHQGGHHLQDPEVIKALEQLSLKPETPLADLGARLQTWLRLELSLADGSRAELRQAVRRCLRSAQRHHKIEGPRGYLDFIHHFMHH